MRGRKPTPTPILAAQGSWRAKTRRNEPQPDAAAPDPPDHLSEGAVAEWRRIVPIVMGMRVLTLADRAALAVYCAAFARWADAEREVAKNGAVVLTGQGYPIQNPHLAVANKAMEQIHKISCEFGLTPSSRSRVHASTDEQPKPVKAGQPALRIAN
jgi:P27 family predicted phage terminase small subunit